MDTQDTTTSRTKRRSITASLKGLFFTLVVLTALWFALRYVLTPLALPKETVEAPISSSPIEPSDYETRIKTLEDKVAALESATPPDITSLEERIAALEAASKAEGMGAAGAAPVDTTVLEALKADIDKLKGEDHTYIRSVILVSQLQEAVRAGRPFAGELATLKQLRPDMKETLEAEEEQAATGIATITQLQEQFQHTIDEALSPAGKKTLVQNLRSLVKIRKIGEIQQGGDDEAVIARAEAQLAKGDVAASLQEIENLSPKALRAFEPWQTRAKAHLQGMAMLEKLRAQIASGATQ